jgi:hypothetical protein
MTQNRTIRCAHGFDVDTTHCGECSRGKPPTKDVRCSHCGQAGHSIRSCEFAKPQTTAPGLARCSSCKLMKRFGGDKPEFYPSRSHPSGHQTRCIACDKRRALLYHRGLA